MSTDMEENIYVKPSLDVSEISMKSDIDPMSYEPKLEILINTKRLREFGNNLTTVIPFDHNALRHDFVVSPPSSPTVPSSTVLRPFSRTDPIDLGSNIHDHREKAYEVLGTSEIIYIEDEREHHTITTAPLTEYNLHEIDAIESMFRDQDMIKPHFHDKEDQIPIHFCMRNSFMGFLWRILYRCCSWFTYICGIVIYI
jgi:hypothetical protein